MYQYFFVGSAWNPIHILRRIRQEYCMQAYYPCLWKNAGEVEILQNKPSKMNQVTMKVTLLEVRISPSLLKKKTRVQWPSFNHDRESLDIKWLFWVGEKHNSKMFTRLELKSEKDKKQANL